MRPREVSGIVTGDALVSYWQEPIFLVPSKNPRNLCDVSFSYLNWQIDKGMAMFQEALRKRVMEGVKLIKKLTSVFFTQQNRKIRRPCFDLAKKCVNIIYATGIVFHGVCGSTSISTFLFPSFSSLKVTIFNKRLKNCEILNIYRTISSRRTILKMLLKKMADP